MLLSVMPAMENIEMASLSASDIAARNKENYLKAKAAFNVKDMAGCMSFYAPEHQIAMSGQGANISSSF